MCRKIPNKILILLLCIYMHTHIHNIRIFTHTYIHVIIKEVEIVRKFYNRLDLGLVKTEKTRT